MSLREVTKNKSDAEARIIGGEEAPQLSGCVRFYQEDGCALVEAKISCLPKVSETGFLVSTFIGVEIAPEQDFQEQKVITIHWAEAIRNTQATCHRYCGAKGTHICP